MEGLLLGFAVVNTLSPAFVLLSQQLQNHLSSPCLLGLLLIHIRGQQPYVIGLCVPLLLEWLL